MAVLNGFYFKNIVHAYGILIIIVAFFLPAIKMTGYNIDHAYGIF